jgi:hypothetical protein
MKICKYESIPYEGPIPINDKLVKSPSLKIVSVFVQKVTAIHKVTYSFNDKNIASFIQE